MVGHKVNECTKQIQEVEEVNEEVVEEVGPMDDRHGTGRMEDTHDDEEGDAEDDEGSRSRRAHGAGGRRALPHPPPVSQLVQALCTARGGDAEGH